MFRRSTAALLALLLSATALGAQTLADYDYEDLSLHGVSLDYGYIWPNKVEPTSRFGVRFDLGYLGPGVRITPTITYWGSRLSGRELGRLAGRLSQLPALRDNLVTVEAEDLGEIRWSAFAINLEGQFAWETKFGVMTYLGAGVGVHKLNGKGELIDGTFIEELLDAVTAGVSGLAGIEFEPVPRMRIYAETNYTLLSYLRYPGLKIGAAYILPTKGDRGR